MTLLCFKDLARILFVSSMGIYLTATLASQCLAAVQFRCENKEKEFKLELRTSMVPGLPYKKGSFFRFSGQKTKLLPKNVTNYIHDGEGLKLRVINGRATTHLYLQTRIIRSHLAGEELSHWIGAAFIDDEQDGPLSFPVTCRNQGTI